MTNPGGFDPDDIIINGLTNFAEATKDVNDAQMGGMVYKSVADVFRQNLKPGDTCAIALPSMIVLPNIRTQCFVAITSSHLIVAWRKGLVRKNTESEVIPLGAITDAQWDVSTAASTRGASLMHVQAAGRSVTFALPKGRADMANVIRGALLIYHSQ
jgi:hypothetical protein